jgi:hypothetical protein
MTGGIVTWTARATRAGLMAGGLGAAWWGLAQNPFAAPVLERTTTDTARAVEAAFHRTFTPGWLDSTLAQALAAGDDARALWLADLAQDEGLALPAAHAQAVATLRARADSWTAQAADCAACAWDIRDCASLAMMAACALPVEISPLGDVNALRRQAMAALTGAEVDRLETGLALVGLGATVLVVVTGGTSAALKAGAGGVRVARRLGSLTPDFARVLNDAADLPVNWGAALRAAPLDEITDTAKLARLGSIAADLGRVATRAGPAETLVLLRHVDSAEDASTLARLADATGPRTLSRVEVLGKSRAFRATLRLTDMAVATLAAIWAAALHLGVTLASLIGKLALRPLLRRLA